jgi:transposase
MDSATSNTPSTPQKTHHLDRDTRREILLLHSIKWRPQQIYDHYKGSVTHSQIQWTLRCNKGTPKKRSGRPPKLSESQIDELQAFITSSKKARRMSYKNLAEHFKFNEDPTTKVYTGADSIKRVLKRRGYSRRITLQIPPTS